MQSKQHILKTLAHMAGDPLTREMLWIPFTVPQLFSAGAYNTHLFNYVRGVVHIPWRKAEQGKVRYLNRFLYNQASDYDYDYEDDDGDYYQPQTYVKAGGKKKARPVPDPDYEYYDLEDYEEDDYETLVKKAELPKFRLQVPTNPAKAPLDDIIPKKPNNRFNYGSFYQRVKQQQAPFSDVQKNVPNTMSLRDRLRQTVMLKKPDGERRPIAMRPGNYGSASKVQASVKASQKKPPTTAEIRDRIRGSVVRAPAASGVIKQCICCCP